MNEHQQIDLHPDKIGGGRPENALNACRNFMREAVRRQLREVRIITGLGIHGDGTPRLRLRVEREVLPAFNDQIEDTCLEQGGAVIRVWLKAPRHEAHPRQVSHALHEKGRLERARREERLMVGNERLRQGRDYLLDDDLRRARLKANQLLREFDPEAPECAQDREGIRRCFDRMEAVLEELEAED